MSSINKIEQKYQVDDVFYMIGKIILLPVLLFGFWFADHGYEVLGGIFECALRKISGLPCPGCGGTRAFYHLFRGEIAQSFRLNPIVLYGTAAYLHFMLMGFYRKHMGNNPGKGVTVQYYLYGAAAVLLIQWMVKIIQIVSIFTY